MGGTKKMRKYGKIAKRTSAAVINNLSRFSSRFGAIDRWSILHVISAFCLSLALTLLCCHALLLYHRYTRGAHLGPLLRSLESLDGGLAPYGGPGVLYDHLGYATHSFGPGGQLKVNTSVYVR